VIPEAELESLIPRARALTAGLSPEQWTARPAPDAWSIAECLEHLNTTNRLYLPAITGKIEEGRVRGWTGDGPFRTGFLEGWFVRALEPPPRMRTKAPKAFLPARIGEPEAILAEWERQHRRLVELAQAASGLHLTRLRVTSPVSRFMKVSLLAAFHLIAAHDRRHLWQAEQARSVVLGSKS
jgi:hypothetical protein